MMDVRHGRDGVEGSPEVTQIDSAAATADVVIAPRATSLRLVSPVTGAGVEPVLPADADDSAGTEPVLRVPEAQTPLPEVDKALPLLGMFADVVGRRRARYKVALLKMLQADGAGRWKIRRLQEVVHWLEPSSVTECEFLTETTVDELAALVAGLAQPAPFVVALDTNTVFEALMESAACVRSQPPRMPAPVMLRREAPERHPDTAQQIRGELTALTEATTGAEFTSATPGPPPSAATACCSTPTRASPTS
jgi:hypothetical protein